MNAYFMAGSHVGISHSTADEVRLSAAISWPFPFYPHILLSFHLNSLTSFQEFVVTHEEDMLCAACRRIGLDADGLNGLMSKDFKFHLKDSYSSLKQSAEAGCDCCALVMEALESSEKDNAK